MFKIKRILLILVLCLTLTIVIIPKTRANTSYQVGDKLYTLHYEVTDILVGANTTSEQLQVSNFYLPETQYNNMLGGISVGYRKYYAVQRYYDNNESTSNAPVQNVLLMWLTSDQTDYNLRMIITFPANVFYATTKSGLIWNNIKITSHEQFIKAAQTSLWDLEYSISGNIYNDIITLTTTPTNIFSDLSLGEYDYIKITYHNPSSNTTPQLTIYDEFTTSPSKGGSIQVTEVINPDFSDFIINSVGGFLNFEIIPGWSISTILALCIMVPILLYVLKYFFGG